MNNYQEDFQKLIASFPPGTVVETQGNRAHIPVQVYQKRLEEAIGEHWHWRIVDMPQILYQEQMVILKGEIQVHQAVRQAIGFSNFKTHEPRSIKNAIASAEADAFRNCCDYFQMGWVDLAPYREWAENPGVNLRKNSLNMQPIKHMEKNASSECCLKCKKPLTGEDIIFLELHEIKLRFCIDDTPKHLIKKRTGDLPYGKS